MSRRHPLCIHVMGALSERGAGVAHAAWGLARSQADQLAGSESVHLIGLRDRSWHEPDSDGIGLSHVAAKYIGPAVPGYSPQLRGALNDRAGTRTVIHSHGVWLHPNHSAANLARIRRLPLVVSPHGMLCPRAFREARWKKLPYYHLVEKDNLKRAACLLAASEKEAADLVPLGLGPPIGIIPFGLSVDGFPDPSAPPPEPLEDAWRGLMAEHPEWRGRRLILFLGRLAPIKAPEHILHAWSLLEKEFPDHHVVYAGPDEDGTLSLLRGRCTFLGLGDRVSFVPRVWGWRKLALLRQSELFVLCSRDENFGFTVLESLASGTPVLASDRTPWGGLVDERCGWFYPFGEEALAGAMRVAMSLPPAEIRKMGLRGREWVAEAFDPRDLAARTLRLYAWLRGEWERPPEVRGP